jgi:hypothetical protein
MAADRKSVERMKPDTRLPRRYVFLTAALFIPLLFAFVAIRDIYPFAASTMMLGIKDKQSAKDYYVLQGETVSGETINLRAIELTNALTGRNWSLVGTADDNDVFNRRWLHPDNLKLIASFGGKENLPPAVRLPDLLRTWGVIYNSRLPQSSTKRLKAVRLDSYQWQGGVGGDYRHFVKSWTVSL